jgi:hypothetical protein
VLAVTEVLHVLSRSTEGERLVVVLC